MPKARENEGDQVVIDFSFVSDWMKSDASFLDQSQSEIKQKKKAILDNVRHSIENCSIYECFKVLGSGGGRNFQLQVTRPRLR